MIRPIHSFHNCPTLRRWFFTITHFLGRCANVNTPRFNIFIYKRTCTNQCSFTNGNTRHNYTVSANIGIVFNGNTCISNLTSALRKMLYRIISIKFISGAKNLGARSKETSVSNVNK